MESPEGMPLGNKCGRVEEPPKLMNEQQKAQRKLERKEARRRQKQEHRDAFKVLARIFDRRPVFREAFAHRPLTLVDVGARGGLAANWNQVAGMLRVIAFDPDARVASHYEGNVREVVFIPKALHEAPGSYPFYVSAHLFESSFLKPNFPLLHLYGIDRLFETTQVIPVETTTLDNIATEHGPWFDFIKIDTQGSELAILRGGESMLRGLTFGLQVEVEFVPLYVDQPLFADIDVYLRARGFELMTLEGLSARRFSRRGLPRHGELDVPKGAGQLTSADALYFRSMDRVRRQLESMSPADCLRFVAGAVATCIVQGYVDYGEEVLEVGSHRITSEAREDLHYALCLYHRERVDVGLASSE